MKKVSTSPRVSSVFIALSFSLLLFSSCKKDPPTYDAPTEHANVMAFNLSPDKSSIAYMLSGWPLGNYPLNFTNYTGMYLPVASLGAKEVMAVDFNSGAAIASSAGTLKDSMHYSLFLLGSKGDYKTIIVEDDINNLVSTPGKAWVRFINGITDDAGTPTINIGEADISEAATYGLMSAFKPVESGNHTASISYAGTIATTRTMMLEENKIYTVFLAGSNEQFHSQQGPQIRIVANGMASSIL